MYFIHSIIFWPGICTVSALAVIHSKFKFKGDFDKIQNGVKSGYLSSFLNFGGSGGYNSGYDGDHHRRKRSQPFDTNASDESDIMTGDGGMVQLAMKYYKEVVVVMAKLKHEESIGSPLVYAGVGMGFMLLVTIGSVLEYFILKRSTDSDVKYSNVALT